MVSAGAGDDFISGSFHAARSRQLLQRRFRMLRRALLSRQIVGPQLQNESFGGFHSAVEIKRADERFDDITNHIVALSRTVVARLLSQADQPRKADAAT